METTDLRCPACRGGFDPTFACPRCGVAYPTIGRSRIPVLVEHVSSYLDRTRTELRRVEGEIARRIQQLDGLASREIRRFALERWRAGLELNLALRQRVVLALPPSPGDAAQAREVGYVRDILEAVRMDWTDDPAGLAGVGRAVAAIVERHADDRARLVVPGAGAGRLAVQAASWFEDVIAIDLSASLAVLYDLLLGEPLDIAEISERSAYRVSDLARPLRAAVPPAMVVAAHGVRFVVADALRVPLLDGSASAVLSAFFTCVVPPSKFLAECARLIRPGGLLVHVGPLGWHFDDPGEMWTQEELRGALPRFGFELIEEAVVPAELSRSPGRMVASRVDAWLFAARRRR